MAGVRRIGRAAGTVDAVVVGAGHSGLAMSRALAEHGVDHVVVERGEVANAWRHERWDSLRLLTPNWQTRLPGFRYAGPDPDGYMTAAEVANFVSGYDWRDGVGPKSARPRVLERAWNSIETNQFGTDEFVAWCRAVGAEPLLATNFGTAGAEMSAAAGPVGRDARAATDAQMKAEMLSYSRTQGLFAGVNLSGGVVRGDMDDNRDLYGDEVSARDVLGGKIEPPSVTEPFMRALARR